MCKHIPNIITLCNLLFGCFSVVAASLGEFQYAGIFILISAVLDLLDGLAAKLLKAQSKIGVQLDSLADLLSFGFAPAYLAFQILQTQETAIGFLSYLVFLMVLASAYRLARFNVEAEEVSVVSSENKSFFIGMPTPANAIFWAAVALHQYTTEVYLNEYFVLAISLIFSYLLVCSLKMFSFKINDFSWNKQKIIYIYILAIIIMVIFFKFLAIAIAILCYPIVSWVQAAYLKSILNRGKK